MEIWLCLSLAYFTVSVVLFLTSRVINSGWQRRVVKRPSYRSFSYPKSVNDRRKSLMELQRQKRTTNFSEAINDLPVTSRPSINGRARCRTRPQTQTLTKPNTNVHKKRTQS
ncbi:unnamed protein product, partial [Rotaria magnacalcarata]